MIFINNLEKGKEYYFYTKSYFWSGFFIEIIDGNIHIENGHIYYHNNVVYCYDKAFLDYNQLIGFAVT